MSTYLHERQTVMYIRAMGRKELIIKKGQRFGLLTVVQEVERIPGQGKGSRAFLCKCDCGGSNTVRIAHLNHGRVKSCGCLWHKQGGLSKTPEYGVWKGIKVRCSPKHHEAHLYYERGITMCDEWKNFGKFFQWTKASRYREGLTIDRIENDKGYSPDNCRWVTQGANNNNRRCTFLVCYHGKIVPFMQVLEERAMEIHAAAIRSRIHRGWSADRAIDTPIRKGAYKSKVRVMNIKETEPGRYALI